MFTVTVGEKAFGFVVPFCFLTLCDFSAEKIHTVYDVCSFSSHAYRQNCFHTVVALGRVYLDLMRRRRPYIYTRIRLNTSPCFNLWRLKKKKLQPFV